MENGSVAADTGGGDIGGGDTGGSSSPSGSESTASREPTQVIPRTRGDGDDGGDDDGPANDNGQPRTRTPKPTKHKVKFFGQEREISSLEEAISLLNDDYEHEIPVSGEKRKAKYPDMVRGYQLSEGAFDRMRKAAELEKSVNERLEHAKQDPEWGLQMMFGVEDPLTWAAERVRKQMSVDAKLKELYDSGNHFEHQRLMDQLADQRKAQRDAFNEAKRKQAEEQKARKEASARTEGEVRKAVEGAGMPWNSATRTIAGEIYAQYSAVGHQLNPADVAAMAREKYIAMINQHIDSYDDEGLVKFLGDARRKKLRQYELAEVRRGGKVQEAPKPAATNGAKRPEPNKGMTEKEFRDQWRR